jgi:hypothetical protein
MYKFYTESINLFEFEFEFEFMQNTVSIMLYYPGLTLPATSPVRCERASDGLASLINQQTLGAPSGSGHDGRGPDSISNG